MGYNPNEPRDWKGRWSKEETRSWLGRHPVDSKNIVEMWDQGTPGEHKAGEEWYPQAHMIAAALGKRYGVSTKEAAGLLATYSPQTAWGQNVRDAAEALREHRPLGGPGERIWWHRDPTTANTVEEREGIMAPGVSKARAERILAGEDPDEVFAGGRNKNGALKPNALKIRAFADLIAYGENSPTHPKVVIDRHAAGVARGVRMTEDDYGIEGPSSSLKKFKPYVDAYVEAAAAISKKEGRTVPPEAVQAATWLTRQRLNSQMESQVGRTRDKLGKRDAKLLSDYIAQYLPEASTYIPKVGYSDLTRHHARPPIDLASANAQKQPKPQQQVQAAQAQQTGTGAVVAAIAAVLLAGGAASLVSERIHEVLARFRIDKAIVSEVVKIVGEEHLPAPINNALPGPVSKAPTRNLFFRAAYIANACHRIARSMARGESLHEAVDDERRYLVQHETASRHRLKAAEQVQTAAEFFGQPTSEGTLVGWYLNPLLNNEAECIAANGHNFIAEHGTSIGLPGSVHNGCGCYAGPPWTGAAMVDDVMRNVHVLHGVTSKAKFRLKERKGA